MHNRRRAELRRPHCFRRGKACQFGLPCRREYLFHPFLALAGLGIHFLDEIMLNLGQIWRFQSIRTSEAFGKGRRRSKDSPERTLSRFRDHRFARHGDGSNYLMIDFWVAFVQVCRHALGLSLLEKLRPSSDLSTDGGLPTDSVCFHNIILAFLSTGCAM
jgi:hypothetical protein